MHGQQRGADHVDQEGGSVMWLTQADVLLQSSLELSDQIHRLFAVFGMKPIKMV